MADHSRAPARRPLGNPVLGYPAAWHNPSMVNTIDARELYEAIQWSYVVVRQAERLTATQDAAYQASEARRQSRTTYEAEDRYPFHRLAADRHFFLNAANQLQRALYKIEYADRMPVEMADLVRMCVTATSTGMTKPAVPEGSMTRLAAPIPGPIDGGRVAPSWASL
jgi:hypothetical protein